MKILHLVVALVLVTVFTVAYPQPASATHWDYCGAGPPDGTGGPWTGWAKRNGVPVYNGPRSTCTLVYTVDIGVRMDYHCYTFNTYGNTWTYMRFPDFGVFGWVWDGNLSNGGSTVPCP